MGKWKSYREESRKDYGSDEGMTPERLMVGCLQRIANSLEKMERPYLELLNRVDYYRRRHQDDLAEKERLIRSNAALRGHLKRMKKERG